MKLKILILIVAALSVITSLTAAEQPENPKTAAELITQAHKHDNMYTLGPDANQQKALSFYLSALAAEPDKKQHLHILYRMAQLNGSSYDLSKGEKPDFRKAIELNKQIIDSYPPQEPLVYKAMSSISSHYTTLWEFENAVKWSKKVLEYDTRQIAEQIETTEQDKEKHSLKKALDKIKRYQKIAVDQAAYSADLIDPLRAHGELRGIIDKYNGTFIADRASKRLSENMDKMPELWAPTDDEPFSASGSTLQAAVGTSAAHTENQKHKYIKTQADTVGEVAKKHSAVEPNTTAKPQNDTHVAKEPRAPPANFLPTYIIVAAILIILGLAGYLRKKKITPYI